MKHALAYGFFGSNHGDVAISRGALALMRQVGCEGTIPIVSHRIRTRWHRNGLAFTREQDPNIEVFAWDNALTTLVSDRSPDGDILPQLIAAPAVAEAFARAMGIAEAETIFYCGGENLFSYGRAKDDFNLLGRLLPMMVAHARGARVFGLGATYGPFESEASRRWIRAFVDIAALIVVRDSNSLERLREVCGERDHIVLGLDSAFFVPDLPGPEREPTGPVGSPPRIALVPRLDGIGLRVGQEASLERVEELKASSTRETLAFQTYFEIGTSLLGRGASVDVFCQTDADIQLTDELSKALEELGGERVTLQSAGRLETYHKLLCRSDLVVASRLHSIIFAAQHAIPSIGLVFEEHGHKTQGVMKLIEAAQWCFDVRQTTLEKVVSAIDTLLEVRPTRARQLNATVERLQASLRDSVRTVLERSQP